MPSSVIRNFRYCTADRVLEIEFVSGWVYRYLNVPEPVYSEMRRSFSKGEFFNTHIRDHFAFERINASR